MTFTGSNSAGREVAARAVKNLRKTVLELGGSDPFIVLEGANPESVARSAALAHTLNLAKNI